MCTINKFLIFFIILFLFKLYFHTFGRYNFFGAILLFISSNCYLMQSNFIKFKSISFFFYKLISIKKGLDHN